MRPRGGRRRFVYGSTIGVYGSAAEGLPTRRPAAPDNIYGRTARSPKSRAEEAGGQPIVRISETYGPQRLRLLKLFTQSTRAPYDDRHWPGTDARPYARERPIEGLLVASRHPSAVGQTFVMPAARYDARDGCDHCRRPGPPVLLRLPLWPFIAAVVFEGPISRSAFSRRCTGVLTLPQVFVFSTKKAESCSLRATSRFRRRARAAGTASRECSRQSRELNEVARGQNRRNRGDGGLAELEAMACALSTAAATCVESRPGVYFGEVHHEPGMLDSAQRFASTPTGPSAPRSDARTPAMQTSAKTCAEPGERGTAALGDLSGYFASHIGITPIG
jgi:hypothetical protein